MPESAARRAGRRRAPGRIRRGPDLSLATQLRVGAKSIAGLGVLGGVATGVGLPTVATAAAEAAPTVQDTPAADVLAARALASDRAARSAARAFVAPSTVVPAKKDTFGVSGISVVAKPTPKKVALDRTYSKSTYAGAGASKGLAASAQVVYSAVRSAFGITNIGGYRSGPGAMDHGTGHAVDVMITSKEQGDAVAAFVMAHASEFNIKYIIWRQRIWMPGRDWRGMADRGSPTANHYDHVHISVH